MSARTIGIIVAYSRDANAGVVASNGVNYIFERLQWSAARLPVAGESVTFVIHTHYAYDIRLFGVNTTDVEISEKQ